MDDSYEIWLKRAVCLAHSLAHIERALEAAEQRQDFCSLPEDIRRQIGYAEAVAREDLDASRRLIRGIPSQN